MHGDDHRSGGQAQFVERPVPVRADTSLEPTFARRFRAETGTTPLRWLTERRITEARRMLERPGLPVEHVARACGFGTAVSLREHFRRATQTTPTAYRAAFRLVAQGRG